MESAMMATAGRAVCRPAIFHPVSASSTSRPSQESVAFRPRFGVSKPVRERIALIHERISESHGLSSSLQPNSVTRGYSDEAGEERPVQSGHSQESRLDSLPIPRREAMGAAIAVMMSAIALPGLATEPEFTLYQDKQDKFSLLVPQEWSKGEGNSGLRKVTAFYPDKEDTTVNVNIVITGLGADYTALGSFGTVDIFAENLVNSLDRAWQKPKGQAAKLIDSRSKNGMYYIEYTIQKPGEAKRHLLSVVGIASNGWINRLYTVTGQYLEEDGDKYKESLQKAISSFRVG